MFLYCCGNVQEKEPIKKEASNEKVIFVSSKSGFKDLLLELGYDVTWDSCPGLHDNVFWNDSLKKAADFLPIEKLEYAPDSPMNRKLRVMNETTT